MFFIQAFEFDQPTIELLKRWFIGILVATINFIYTELFYTKWSRLQKQRNFEERISELESHLAAKNNELGAAYLRLEKANADVDRLVDYVAELEVFKKNEMDKVTCSFCKQIFKSVYHLNSHRTNCEMNPKKGERDSVFEAVV